MSSHADFICYTLSSAEPTHKTVHKTTFVGASHPYVLFTRLFCSACIIQPARLLHQLPHCFIIVFNGNMASLSLLRNLLSCRNGGGQDGATDHTSLAGPGDRPVSEEAVLINASPSGPGDSPSEEAVLEDMSPPGPGDRPSEEADMLKNLVNVGNGGQDDSKPVAKASQEEVEAPPSPGVRPPRKIMTAEEKLGQIQDDLSHFLYVMTSPSIARTRLMWGRE